MKKIGGMELRDYGALLFRQSMASWRPQKLADELHVSLSLVHKIQEGERAASLVQWLETICATRDLEGVKRLVRDLGGVVVWRRESLAQALRDLAEELEANLPPAAREEGHHPHNPIALRPAEGRR